MSTQNDLTQSMHWGYKKIWFHKAITFRWKIQIGDFNHGSDKDDGNAKNLEIIKKFVHPNYDGIKSYFDVAILETEEITFSRAISPVCLPNTISNDIHAYDNDQAELIGWGSSTTTGIASSRLQRVVVKVYKQE